MEGWDHIAFNRTQVVPDPFSPIPSHYSDAQCAECTMCRIWSKLLGALAQKQCCRGPAWITSLDRANSSCSQTLMTALHPRVTSLPRYVSSPHPTLFSLKTAPQSKYHCLPGLSKRISWKTVFSMNSWQTVRQRINLQSCKDLFLI